MKYLIKYRKIKYFYVSMYHSNKFQVSHVEEISFRHVLTYGSSHQSLHTKSHPFNKLLRPLDGSLENHR